MQKPFIFKANSQSCITWCIKQETWNTEQRKWFSRIYFYHISMCWRKPKDAFNTCLLPSLRYDGRSIIIQTAMLCKSLGSVIALHGRIRASKYEAIFPGPGAPYDVNTHSWWCFHIICSNYSRVFWWTSGWSIAASMDSWITRFKTLPNPYASLHGSRPWCGKKIYMSK